MGNTFQRWRTLHQNGSLLTYGKLDPRCDSEPAGSVKIVSESGEIERPTYTIQICAPENWQKSNELEHDADFLFRKLKEWEPVETKEVKWGRVSKGLCSGPQPFPLKLEDNPKFKWNDYVAFPYDYQGSGAYLIWKQLKAQKSQHPKSFDKLNLIEQIKNFPLPSGSKGFVVGDYTYFNTNGHWTAQKTHKNAFENVMADDILLNKVPKEELQKLLRKLQQKEKEEDSSDSSEVDQRRRIEEDLETEAQELHPEQCKILVQAVDKLDGTGLATVGNGYCNPKVARSKWSKYHYVRWNSLVYRYNAVGNGERAHADVKFVAQKKEDKKLYLLFEEKRYSNRMFSIHIILPHAENETGEILYWNRNRHHALEIQGNFESIANQGYTENSAAKFSQDIRKFSRF